MKDKISSIVLQGEKCIKKILGACVDFLTLFVWTVLWLPLALKNGIAGSYFPEYPRKNMVRRIFENVFWDLRFHRANGFYTLYGLDIRGKSSKAYIDENSFWKKLNELNYSKGPTSQICLLRDKFMFYKYMKSNHLPVPEVFGVIKNGKLYSTDLNEISVELLKNKTDYFLKDVDGECASFVKHIRGYNDLKKISERIKTGFFILQESVHQSKKMNEINDKSINTLRIVTVNSKGKIRVLSSLLRVGTKETGNVDNWAAGGLAIGIDSNSYLKKYGFYKPGHGLKLSVHPDSKVVFEKYKVPMLDEAYNLAIKAHKFFYNVGAIGWDIAITENGPVFIEGNDNFEITLMQACDRPLKREWKAL